jgi:hypothetical protein
VRPVARGGQRLNREQAIIATGGGLSEPSKMPCPSYSIPARACLLGSKLVKVPGTTCHGCYALKGNYVRFPVVQDRLQERLESLGREDWGEGMVYLIRESKARYFRWHDSGDLQSLAHLDKIVAVCRELPQVQFWLPTREYDTVTQWQARHPEGFPPNLVVRMSAHRLDGEPPRGYGLPTSTVHTSPFHIIGKLCRASERDNKCGRCRACWDPKVGNVSYPKH